MQTMMDNVSAWLAALPQNLWNAFMNGMEWFTSTGAYKVVLLVGLGLILAGIFRAAITSGVSMGEASLSALALIVTIVVLLLFAPLLSAFGWVVQSIPFVGDLMDYGTILTLVDKEPLKALYNFADCFILMVLADLAGRLSYAENPFRKFLFDFLTMLVCVLILEFIKGKVHATVINIVYTVSGLGVLAAVMVVLGAAVSGSLLPPIFSMLPRFIVKPLATTCWYVMALIILGDFMGLNLPGIAASLTRVLGAFAVPAIMIAGIFIMCGGLLGRRR